MEACSGPLTGACSEVREHEGERGDFLSLRQDQVEQQVCYGLLTCYLLIVSLPS